MKKGKNTKTIEVLDKVKKALKIDTDYKLAKFLGIPRSSIHRYYQTGSSISIDKLNDMLKGKGYEVELKIKKIKN